SAFFAFPGPGVDEGPPFFAAYLDVGDVHYLFLVVVVCVVGGSGSCFVDLSCLAGRDRWQTDATRSTRPKLFASAALVAISGDRKSTRLNSSHVSSSYAVFCLNKTTTSIIA